MKCEMNRLRTQCSLQLSFVPVYTLNPNCFKICFHNAQSLHLHSMDMQADFNFCDSTINMFVETRLCSADPDILVEIPGFTIHRNDFSSQRSAYGSILYFKEDIQCTCQSLNKDNIEISLIHVSIPVQTYCHLHVLSSKRITDKYPQRNISFNSIHTG